MKYPMNYLVHIDTISMELSMLYLKGLSFNFSYNDAFLCLKVNFKLVNRAALCSFCQTTCLQVSRMIRARVAFNLKFSTYRIWIKSLFKYEYTAL